VYAVYGGHGDRLSPAGQISICRQGHSKIESEGYERVGRLWKEPVGGGAFAVVTRLIHRPRASSRFRGQECLRSTGVAVVACC